MRILLIYFAILSCANVYGEGLSTEDIKNLHSDIEDIYVAFEAGDTSVFLAKTHHSIYTIAGGRESFKQIMEGAVTQLKSTGIKFLESELKSPSQVYIAGDEEVCFVPRVSIMELEGNKMQSTGFMIAAREIGAKEWRYLDGSGLRNNQGLLWQLFPELNRDISLPPNYITLIQ